MLAAFALGGCWQLPEPAPPPDPEGPPPTEGECARACDRFRELGCEEGDPSPGGVTCEQVCENAAEEGVSLPAACVVGADSCDAARSC